MLSSIIKDSKLYLDKPYIKIAWNAKEGILINHFRGFATHEEIVEIGKRIVEAVKIEKANKILYDARGLEIIDDISRNYIVAEFTNDISKAGVVYAATVLPEDIFAKGSMGRIKDSLKHLDDVNQFFSSVTKALEWLRSM
ncbi:MAG: hypothetical protein RJQ09_02590 [Cyclobacteriaceae bacterium]